MTIKVGFGAVGILGGKPGNLDFISSSTIHNKDISIVIENKKLFFYRLNQYSNEKPNYPHIIKPVDIIPSSPFSSKMKRWELISQEVFVNDIIQLSNLFLYTKHINFLNKEIFEVGNNQYIVFENDNVSFPSVVSGIDPIDLQNITTINYINNQLTILTNDIYDYLESKTYIFNNTTRQDIKDYLDTRISDLETSINNYVESQKNVLENNIETPLNDGLTHLNDIIISYIDDNIDYLENTYDPGTYTRLLFSSSTWTSDGNYFYTDINHNLETYNFLEQFWVNNEVFFPSLIKYLDKNTIRLWTIYDNIEVYTVIRCL